jgi:hypothetical protein
LQREVGATDVVVERLLGPGTRLAVYSLVFPTTVDSSASRRALGRLRSYVPVDGLAPTRVGGTPMLVRQNDAVLSSTAVWSSGRRMVLVTGGRLNDETAVLAYLVGTNV